MNRAAIFNGYYQLTASEYQQTKKYLDALGLNETALVKFKQFIAAAAPSQNIVAEDVYVPVTAADTHLDPYSTHSSLDAAVIYIRSGETLGNVARRFKIASGAQGLVTGNRGNPFVENIDLIRAGGYLFIRDSTADEPVAESCEDAAALPTAEPITDDGDESDASDDGDIPEDQGPLLGMNTHQAMNAAVTSSFFGNLGVYMVAPQDRGFGALAIKDVRNGPGAGSWVKMRYGQGPLSLALQFPGGAFGMDALNKMGLDLRVGTRPASVGVRLRPFEGNSHVYGRVADPVEGHRISVPVATPGLRNIPDTVSLKVPMAERAIWAAGKETEVLISRQAFFDLVRSVPQIGAENAAIRLQYLTGFILQDCRKLIALVSADEQFLSQTDFLNMVRILKQRGIAEASQFLSARTGIALERCQRGLSIAWSATGFVGLVLAEFILYLGIGFVIDEAAELLDFDPDFSGRQQVQLATTIVAAQGLRAGATYVRTGALPSGLAGSTLTTLGWAGVGLTYNEAISCGIEEAADEFGFDPNFTGRGAVQFTGTTTGLLGTRYAAGRALSAITYQAPSAVELGAAIAEGMGAPAVVAATEGTASVGAAVTGTRVAAATTATAAVVAEGGMLARAFMMAKGPALVAAAMALGIVLFDEFAKTEDQELAEAELEREKALAALQRKNEAVLRDAMVPAVRQETDSLVDVFGFLAHQYAYERKEESLARLNHIFERPEKMKIIAQTPRLFADAVAQVVSDYIDDNPPPAISGDNPDYGAIEYWETETNAFLAPLMLLQTQILSLPPPTPEPILELVSDNQDPFSVCEDEVVEATPLLVAAPHVGSLVASHHPVARPHPTRVAQWPKEVFVADAQEDDRDHMH